MTSEIRFAKMEGVGNDFVVTSAELLSEVDCSAAARKLCERRAGVGADGLLVVGPAPDGAAFSFRMYNPDGTADMCGNGLRCAVLYAHQTGLLRPVHGEIRIDTISGLVAAEILSLGGRDKTAVVRVAMPVPKFAPAEIPFADTEPDKVIDYMVHAGDAPVVVTAVNTGSTHCVVFCDELPGDAEFFLLGPLIEHHPYFPQRTSVIWSVETGSTEFMVRIWERAVGETLGCGTGACAVAAAAILKSLADYDDEIVVVSKGGELGLKWPAVAAPMQMTGPARWVYEGVLRLGHLSEPRAGM